MKGKHRNYWTIALQSSLRSGNYNFNLPGVDTIFSARKFFITPQSSSMDFEAPASILTSIIIITKTDPETQSAAGVFPGPKTAKNA